MGRSVRFLKGVVRGCSGGRRRRRLGRRFVVAGGVVGKEEEGWGRERRRREVVVRKMVGMRIIAPASLNGVDGESAPMEM